MTSSPTGSGGDGKPSARRPSSRIRARWSVPHDQQTVDRHRIDHLAVQGSPANRRLDSRGMLVLAVAAALCMVGIAPFLPSSWPMVATALVTLGVGAWAYLTPVTAPAWVRTAYSGAASLVTVVSIGITETLPAVNLGSNGLFTLGIHSALTRSRREVVGQLLWQQLLWGGYLLATGPLERVVVGVAVSAGVLGVSAAGTVWLRELVESALRELAASAHQDPLTRLLNRRGLAAAHPSTPTCWLLVLDLDHFKRINDEHGHAVGDEILTWVADVLTATARPGEVAARLGGEEFVLRLPEGVDAAERAEEVRAAVAAGSRTCPVPVTVSLGVAHGRWEDLPQVLAAADVALYDAKRAGRDRVVLAPGTSPGTAWSGPGRRAHRASI